MNQPPGGFDPPDDGYGGSGRRGGTIPGGPPIEVDGSGMPVGPAPGAAAGPVPGAPAATVVDHAVSPAAYGQQPGAMPAPAYPALNAGPIGYAPVAPPRRRSSGGSGLGIVFAMGFVVLLIGGGAAGAVIYARGASEGTDEEDTAPILTFAPPSTIEAEGVQPSLPEDPITDPGEVPLDGTGDPGVATPPPATTHTPPPATTTARPPSTSTATATSTAKPPSTTTGTSTVRPPGPTPTATTTATTTATATSTRWRTPWVIKPPGTSTATSTATATGTSTSTPPARRFPPGGFKIPKPK